MTTKAERIAQLKAELAELEKEPEQLVIFDGWEPEKGDIIYWPNLNAACVYDSVFKEKYEAKFAFRNPKQVAAILDAFCVLMELRNQEGAGTISRGDGFVFIPDIYGEFCIECWTTSSRAFRRRISKQCLKSGVN